MADIFLSYNENDRDTVRRLADTLKSVGWSVWWDRRIPAGGTWRQLLERELQSMRCMVVVWSSHSVKSEWVCEEATEGRQLGRLVPVCIERVKPPAGFREIQAADLVEWDGSATFVGMKTLIEDIEQLIGKGSIALPQSDPVEESMVRDPARGRFASGASSPFASSRAMFYVAGIVGAALVAGAVVWGLTASKSGSRAEDTNRTSGVATAPPLAIPTDVAGGSVSNAAITGDTPNAANTASPNVAAHPDAALQSFGPLGGGTREKVLKQPKESSNDPRCADLLARVSLGETLSSESKSFMQRQCAR